MKTEFDILIVGAGLVGLTTALTCAESGAQVALLDHRKIETGKDGRVTALSSTSLQLFENLGLDLSGELQTIDDMLVTEGTPNSPWRLHFDSNASGLGAIIENPALKRALIERVMVSDQIQTFDPIKVFDFKDKPDGIHVETDQGPLKAHLLVAADGRDSVTRRKAGFTVQRFDYDAASLVTTISHELPHDGLAWQRIIKGGALAVLPLIGNRSQIVWSGPTQSIEAATNIDEAEFIAILSEKMDGYLGEMTCIAARQAYPLRLQITDNFSLGRIVLVGDAAHIIHPLAGQGLNLGLRDAAALAEGVIMSRQTGQDIGVASLLEYKLWRNTDTKALGALTHLISTVSGAKLGPIGHARRLGLAMTNRSSTVKFALSKRAAGEARDLPELMRRPL